MNLMLLCAPALLGLGAVPAAAAPFLPTPLVPSLTVQEPKPAPAPDAAPAQGGIPECKDMQKTATGLEYGFLAKGGAESPPGPLDTVEVHYTGWLLDGTRFDSSRDRGQPAQFALNRVIKGWTEALQLMAPGARCKLVIPADIAYGAAGRDKIPANATLVFDVELLRVIKRMPRFSPGNPDAQKVTKSGIKWEMLKAGAGAKPTAAEGFSMRFAVWRPNGELIECTERSGSKIAGTLESLQFPFLSDVVAECSQGGVLRAEVPKDVFPNTGDKTIWELELVSINKLPVFRSLDASKVVKCQSGLMYEVLELGTGEHPRATDTVVANYSGWLPDGKLFDSSFARGEPTEFPLNGVIKGWTEGLQRMKVGGKFLFQIPPELAYGAEGMPPTIPGNATLVFLVELVAVKKR